MSRTCALCRERAVNCDGVEPTCAPCAALGSSIACDYSSRAVGPNSKSPHLLQKGAACLPCRRKKKKCDAMRPCCTTCKATNKQARCLYEDDAQRSLIQSLVARTRELEERLASAEQYPRNLSPRTPSLEWFSAQHPPYLPADVFTALPAWKPPVTYTPALNNLDSRTTLEQLRALAHFGLELTPEASDALAAGDFYSPHIHPALIRAAQLVGCMIWQDKNRMTSLMTLEMFELEATLSLLTDDVEPIVALQVHNILAVYYFLRRRLSEGTARVRVASELVHRYNLRFGHTHNEAWDPLLEPTPEAEKQVCALSHLLCMDIDRYMVMGIPSDLGADYEREFLSIPIMYPLLSRSHLTILRARGSLLLHRSRQLCFRLRAASPSPWDLHLGAPGTSAEPAWVAEYWSLLEEVEMSLAVLNPTLLKVSLHPHQRTTSHGLKVCLIVTLTAEAELHHLTPRTHTESRQHCLNAVLKLVGVGKTLTAEDYTMLDPVLGVCWLTAARVTLEESAEPMDELSAMNWATARSVLVAVVPVLINALPYLEVPLNQILEKAAVFVLPS